MKPAWLVLGALVFLLAAVGFAVRVRLSADSPALAAGAPGPAPVVSARTAPVEQERFEALPHVPAPTAQPNTAPASAPLPKLDPALMAVAFPDHPPVQYTHDGMSAVMAEVSRECHLPIETMQVDCTEYPCVAWTKLTAKARPQRLAMDQCAPWKQAFPRGAYVVGGEGADGQQVLGWLPVPDDDGLKAAVQKRLTERRKQMAEQLGLD
jgi:hypothetical protein